MLTGWGVARSGGLPSRIVHCLRRLQDSVYGQVAARHPEAFVIVPPRSSAVPSDTADTASTMRNRHLQIIDERGRMAWQKSSGYHSVSLAQQAACGHRPLVEHFVELGVDTQSCSMRRRSPSFGVVRGSAP